MEATTTVRAAGVVVPVDLGAQVVGVAVREDRVVLGAFPAALPLVVGFPAAHPLAAALQVVAAAAVAEEVPPHHEDAPYSLFAQQTCGF